jgi:hypothetical protein
MGEQRNEMKTEIPVSMAKKLAQEMNNNEDRENYVGQILESKYDQVSPAEVAAAQKHLTPEQRKSIETLATKYPRLFSGKLGVYPGRKIHLEVEPGAIPVHARPYSVARLHLEVFKQELK